MRGFEQNHGKNLADQQEMRGGGSSAIMLTFPPPDAHGSWHHFMYSYTKSTADMYTPTTTVIAAAAMIAIDSRYDDYIFIVVYSCYVISLPALLS